jgi:flagellar basal body rod protein FlgF
VIDDPSALPPQGGELSEGCGDHRGRTLPVGIVGDERPAVAERDGGEGAGCAGALVAGATGMHGQNPTLARPLLRRPSASAT